MAVLAVREFAKGPLAQAGGLRVRLDGPRSRHRDAAPSRQIPKGPPLSQGGHHPSCLLVGETGFACFAHAVNDRTQADRDTRSVIVVPALPASHRVGDGH